ncbi:MAG: hypothetical protein ABSE16_21335 [Verrucomicrobiota bacterium]
MNLSGRRFKQSRLAARVVLSCVVFLTMTIMGPLWCGSSQAQTFVQDGSLNTAVTSASSSSVSTSFTVTAGAQALLWGTQTIARVVSQNNLTSHYADSDIYYLWNPTPGTHTITATDTTSSTPSAMTMQVITLSGVNTNVAPATYGIGNADVDGTPGISVALAGSTPGGGMGGGERQRG